jgi:hypothetical protein
MTLHTIANVFKVNLKGPGSLTAKNRFQRLGKKGTFVFVGRSLSKS